MPRGDKSAYTDKQKRKAEHIEESYESHMAEQAPEELARELLAFLSAHQVRS